LKKRVPPASIRGVNKYKGQTRIIKRGRPRLRALFHKCIMPLVSKNQEFKARHQYYTTRAENPLKKKHSLIALCCRLIRVLSTLGKKKLPYDGRKLLTNPLVSSRSILPTYFTRKAKTIE